MSSDQEHSDAVMVCVPHVPFLELQGRRHNQDFWAAYEVQAERIRAFDPELVFVFGADHYGGQHLQMMPAFAIGHRAQAIADDGGYPGQLNIPRDISEALASYLIDNDFDVATSYAMEVDHGFSAVIHHLLGGLDARSIVPIFVNALCSPRPTLRRCRAIGAAVGAFAAATGKRVAFIGSGGLSHETGEVFPQYDDAPSEAVRDYIVYGGKRGELSRERWMNTLNQDLQVVNGLLLDRVPGVGSICRDWDDRFVATFSSGDLAEFDRWEDVDIVREGGNSAGEIRMWVAAAAAAQAAGAGDIIVDYYQHDLPMGVAGVVTHA